MQSELYNVLSVHHSHERDKNIQFFEEGHQYKILTEPNIKYVSVTTWCHKQFPNFDADSIIESMQNSKSWKKGHKYWGLNANEIKSLWNSNKDNVANAGTDLHFEIECFNNNKEILKNYTNKELYDFYILKNMENHLLKPIEWQYFINFVKDFPELKPFRTEWLIYHEDIKISGSIDMVYENSDGTYYIYDWKRSKNITRINNFNKFAINPLICHLPDSNYWHYTLQLNIYKFILEEKYNIFIKDLYLVRLHPLAEELNYDLIKLPILKREMNDLFNERKFNLTNMM